mgnify:FL=1
MNFKRLFSGVALVSLLVGASVAQATDIKNFPRVAVMNFGNKAITSQGLRDQDFSSATEYAIYQLSASGWFDLIDYEQLSTIANMHSINMSGLVDPATTVEIGKFAGAEYMVVGYLTGLTTKENVLGYQHGDKGGFDNAQHVVTANVAVRIVDIKTGRIIVAGLGKGSSTSTYTELKFTKYRNRKIETEDISNTVTRDQKNEYTRNSNTTSNQSNTYDKNKKNTQNTTRTDDSSNTYGKDNTINKKSDNTVHDTRNNTTEKSNQTTNSVTGNTQNTINKTPSVILKGDVNNDGVVNNDDVVLLTQVLGDCDVDYDVSNADMNGDGEITITDLSQLKMLVENTPNHTIYPDLVIDSENTDSNQEYKKDNSNVNTTTDTIGKETSKTDSLENNTSTTENKTNSNNVTSTNENETTETQHSSNERNSSVDETINKADNVNTVLTNNKNIYYERDQLDYVIRIGTVEVSDIQVRNAISKAVRDAIYGNMGIMTTLNNGKKLKIKTGF